MHLSNRRFRLLAAVLATGGIGSGCPAEPPSSRTVVAPAVVASAPASEPLGWTKHLVWIVPLAFLLMILVILMRRTDDE